MFDLLTELIQTFESRVRDPQIATEAGLAPFQARALGFFVRFPEKPQQSLANYSGRDRAQVTRVIHELEAKGLVTRQPDPSDKRKICIQPTAAGRDAFAVIKKHREETKAVMLRRLSDREIESMTHLLKKMKLGLEETSQSQLQEGL